MKKLLLTSIIASSIILTPLTHANDKQGLSDQHEEEISFGAGAIIGGILGGPAGAMITGLASTFIMKNVNNEEKLVALIDEKDQQEASFQTQIAQLNKQMRNAEHQYQQELLDLENVQQKAGALQASNLMMSLQFKTGSSQVPEYYQEQVQALANILNHETNLTIDLSGYTDLLGDSELNQKLSQARANSVKEQLVAFGVDEARISTFAFGDKKPVVANAQNQSSYYDRRVMISVKQPSEQVAKNY
ncbi:sortase-associated OmpA-like protein PdsO [Thalassotalea sp. M1531]|uniref:Sortase-associated OmpA-like protein PdsO n=1 Tax=Thalassotalea algicola TaxID=2716224 RepID=A0A7Y0Q7H8_9GAMM|nr:sortase-associated OmpA-like protein PdsO [Thalassotalea algicola]NMP32418.1 sortase-associated OmpA-like protein PdsO [Thalassotalea algicola]